MPDSPKPAKSTKPTKSTEPTDEVFDPMQRILRGLTGTLVAATIASFLYGVTGRIIVKFASSPVTSDNVTVKNLSAAVRTLVIGMSALGTFIFAFAATGLLLLSVKTAIDLLGREPSES
ncbi:MAG: DUF3082 domain-containing protein [Geitlerinemataceae cyanobacterium]